MSCCRGSSIGDNETKINKQEKKSKSSELRLLLLGAGESGKSTVAKQMKIIHNDGFSEDEVDEFVPVIHTNIYQSCKSIIQASEDLGVPIKDKSLLPFFDLGNIENLDAEYGSVIKRFWADEGVQELFARKTEFQLIDSAEYYLNDVERITAPGYCPTVQDILRTRVQTTGMTETRFSVDGTNFVLVDVGGQRSERKKWMYCFEDLTAVLFVVSLAGIDLTLYEDRKTNRMQEALKLFHEICISKWFTNCCVILFLNKTDLFKAKLESGATIKNVFPDYPGDSNFKTSCEYVRTKFVDVCDPLTNKPKDIFVHFTCATDTDNVRHVFNSIKEFLFNQILKNSAIGFGM